MDVQQQQPKDAQTVACSALNNGERAPLTRAAIEGAADTWDEGWYSLAMKSGSLILTHPRWGKVVVLDANMELFYRWRFSDASVTAQWQWSVKMKARLKGMSLRPRLTGGRTGARTCDGQCAPWVHR